MHVMKQNFGHLYVELSIFLLFWSTVAEYTVFILDILLEYDFLEKNNTQKLYRWRTRRLAAGVRSTQNLNPATCTACGLNHVPLADAVPVSAVAPTAGVH